MPTQISGRLLIVGNNDIFHLGAGMQRAAQTMHIPVEVCDTKAAFDTNWFVRQLNWRFRNHRPPQLDVFSHHVLESCRAYRPKWMLSIGFAPIKARALEKIHQSGVVCLNYLTDDPWNPARRSNWFFEALPQYDGIFSPRRANLRDLVELGCGNIMYLPFAYDPHLHFPDPPKTVAEQQRYECDVLFYGGADRDRLPYIKALLRQGVSVHLYGNYWKRYLTTRVYAQGHAASQTLRKAVGGAKVTLCLVRRANRDGHVMRSYEVPAMGGCMLTEDTPEHREILGNEDAECVVYFRTEKEIVESVKWLLANDEARQCLAQQAYAHITDGANTYRDRLQTMLDTVEAHVEDGLP